ncbi:MAG: redoxin domain-containing protein [Bacteroidota bacterium]
MHKILLTICVSVSVHSTAQQSIAVGAGPETNKSSKSLDIGDFVYDLSLPPFLNSNQSSRFQDLSGKVLIIEFWATWCGPCLPAMEHLADLKTEFNDQIEVIAISYESETRVLRYIKNKPSPILHISDIEGVYKQYFNHRSIPHAVLIDPAGKIAAFTSPDEITSDVIKDIMTGKPLDITMKKESARAFDYTKDYFPPKPGTREKFMIQPEMSGAIPITRRVKSKKSEFQNRRVTLLNQSLYNIYRYAFEIGSDSRMKVDTKLMEKLKTERYCIEVISPTPELLFTTFQQGLLDNDLPYRALIERTEMPVLEIHATGSPKLVESQANQSPQKRAITSRLGKYAGKNKTMDDFTNEYLNPYLSPSANKPFVNQTGLTGRYDFDFSFEAEDPQSFKREMEKLGFKLVSTTTTQEVLVITEKIN